MLETESTYRTKAVHSRQAALIGMCRLPLLRTIYICRSQPKGVVTRSSRMNPSFRDNRDCARLWGTNIFFVVPPAPSTVRLIEASSGRRLAAGRRLAGKGGVEEPWWSEKCRAKDNKLQEAQLRLYIDT